MTRRAARPSYVEPLMLVGDLRKRLAETEADLTCSLRSLVSILGRFTVSEWLVGGKSGDGGSGDDYLRGQYDETVLLGGSGTDIVSSHPISPVASMDGGSGTDTCDPPDVPARSCEIIN